MVPQLRRQGLDADRPHGRKRRIEIECEELPRLAETAGGNHVGGAPVDPLIEAGAVGNNRATRTLAPLRIPATA